MHARTHARMHARTHAHTHTHMPSPRNTNLADLLVTCKSVYFTETGGINIAPLPAYECNPLKPGFVMKPFFGVQPVIVDNQVGI